MANPKLVDAQRDFTAGEVDSSAKRGDDDTFLKTGMRQLSNARILNTRALCNRPGRNLLMSLATGGRVEDVLMAPTARFRLSFTAGTIIIYDGNNVAMFGSATLGDGTTPIPWTAATVNQIVWAVYRNTIYLTFPGIPPQVLAWDGVSTWTLSTYTEMSIGAQKRTPFYRFSPPGIVMYVSAITGVVNIAFSAPVLTAGMVGTCIRFCERQLRILTVTDSQHGTATVMEPLPPGMSMAATGTTGVFNLGDEVTGLSTGALGIVTGTPSSQLIDFVGSSSPAPPSSAVPPQGTYNVGDHVTGASSGASGTVTNVTIAYYSGNRVINMTVALTGPTPFNSGEVINPGGYANITASIGALIVQLLPNSSSQVGFFVNGEVMVGPSGRATVSSPAVVGPQGVSVWDQEVMNSYRGYPSSCFVDQNRLGLCNFPSLPGGIGWSAIGLPTDMFPGANPSDSIFELAPGKSQVLHVTPGAESSEFVFCDNAVYYIPISPTNPLRPGSVAFLKISGDGAAAVQPRAVGGVILYVDRGLVQVESIVATGAYNRPFENQPLTDVHGHLFNAIRAIALPTSVTQFAERYAYVLNGDGSVAVGKYVLDAKGNLAGRVGWLPWTGAGQVQWVSALNDAVLFQSDYTSGGTTAHVLEQLDATLYLDASLLINAPPAALVPPSGKGPLWWLPGATVWLYDGQRPLGPYATDANGFLIPVQQGEDLTSVTLRAGFPWIATWEPFVHAAQPGQDVLQRMRKRRIARMEAYVMQSSGFRFIKMNTAGDVVGDKRIATWYQGDDPNLPPPLREAAYAFKPTGRAHDPRAAIQKDTPGPLLVPEIAIRVTV